MYLPRHIDQILLDWSLEEDRKPLILRGARQTGKSSSIRYFGSRFELFLELNLERHSDLSLVRSCRSGDELLVALAARHGIERFPEQTLLFLDEIQESPEAVRWLRFFREDHPELYVVAAGSLMEVRLQERGFSFPVGRVTFRALRPFTFFEFLEGTGAGVLGRRLVETLRAGVPAPEALHAQAMERFNDYVLVGGMPEAVARWVGDRNPAAVRTVHADLVESLSEDLQKYRGVRDVAYLEAAFDNLKHHYGSRFKYQDFAPGYRSQQMKSALGKLEAAQLITRVWPTSSLRLPLRIRPKSAPKLLPLDSGLALYTMGADLEHLQSLPFDRLLDGRAAEIFAGHQMLAARSSFPGKLHFWVNESPRSSAEVDYLLETSGYPLPVEVKSGASGSLKSLHQFLWRSGLEVGVRLHMWTLRDEVLQVRMPDRDMHYRLISLPLYMAEHVSMLSTALRDHGKASEMRVESDEETEI